MLVRSVLKSYVLISSRPWEIGAFKGHFEVVISSGSGMRDPQLEIRRIETTIIYVFVVLVDGYCVFLCVSCFSLRKQT